MVHVLSRLFGLLTLLTNLATLAGLLLLWRPDPQRLATVRAHGLGATSAVTGVATIGSLYYSQVVGYPPCSLCWFQRVFMYSAATILFVALARFIRRSGLAPGVVPPPGVWQHVVPLAVLGLPISLYHLAVERLPALGSDVCSPDTPCSTIWVEVFGFITLPYMAASAFAFVLVVAALITRHPAPLEEP